MTDEQKEKMKVYKRCLSTLGRPPTVTEFAAMLNIGSHSVWFWAKKMRAQGTEIEFTGATHRAPGRWQERREEYLQAAQDYIDEVGTEPTAADIARRVGVSREAVHQMINNGLRIPHVKHEKRGELFQVRLPEEQRNMIYSLAEFYHTSTRQVMLGIINRAYDQASDG